MIFLFRFNVLVLDSLKSGKRHYKSVNQIVEKFLNFFGDYVFDLKILPVPQQTNGSDCGVFVMKYMDLLINEGEPEEKKWKNWFESSPSTMMLYRLNVLSWIEKQINLQKINLNDEIDEGIEDDFENYLQFKPDVDSHSSFKFNANSEILIGEAIDSKQYTPSENISNTKFVFDPKIDEQNEEAKTFTLKRQIKTNYTIRTSSRKKPKVDYCLKKVKK